MLAKGKSHPLNMAHTAGIFSDMSIDGPEIGTLVLVVDRAKNLPNRKTIGKQDPYCAARLGKEAKKTVTDIRGGQTPKWDQELRFTVHDCPDYYQLKVSVFNDDKKTDLIGESWIDLRDIIISGGGQSDQWHTLNCKGKYAGEIRIEITFYDTRPKPEKPIAKPKQVPESEGTGTLPRGGPRRRPLPSDPVTGQSSVPDHVHNTPQPQPNPPTSHIPTQSPLQAIEYNTPPPPVARHREPVSYSSAPAVSIQSRTPSRPEAQPHHHRSMDRYDQHSVQHDDHDLNPDFQSQRYEDYDHHDSRNQYDDGPIPINVPAFDDPMQLPPDDDRPPPPPVHRSRNNSGGTHEFIMRNSLDMPPQRGTPPTMRQGVLRNEAHRQSMSSAYPGRPAYKPYDSAPAVTNGSKYSTPEPHQPSPPRHHSFDSAYDPHSRSMQPTVEDAPESPSPMSLNSFRRSGSRVMSRYDYDEPDFGQVPSPAPLNLSGRGSATSGHFSPGPVPNRNRHDSNGFPVSPSPIPPRDYGQTNLARRSGSYNPHDPYGQQYSARRSELDDTRVESPGSYALPPLPPSLVPGVDPGLALEISSRFNEERRRERRPTQQNVATPPRGRQMMIEAPPNYGQNSSPQPYHTPEPSHELSPITYSGGPSPTVVKPRAISPNPSPNTHHTIKRKSISPAPPSDDRRLSGIPFGPDSYDALNPSVVSSSSKESRRSDYHESNGKIITHDGREIDPSDHLPMDTWAPEPEPKQPKLPTTPTSRPSPNNSAPTSGKRPLRVAGRPHSMATLPPTYISDVEPSPPPVPTGRNRLQKKTNRQSAMPVMSGAAGGSSPLAPLPQPHYQDNFTPPRALPRANTFDYPNENHAPMNGSSPGRGSAPPIPAKIPIGGGGGGGGAPMMSGALPAPGPKGGNWGGSGVGSELALMEEMSRIDIGTGRARRHHGRY